jgi:hypothetical protein
MQLGRLVWAFALEFGIGQAKSATSLTVLVYNYASVPAGILADAQVFAARSYRAAGIELTWTECSTSHDTVQLRACETANDGHPPVLKLIPDKMAAGMTHSATQPDYLLGVARVSYAYIFYPRVREMADHCAGPESVILGRAMAHELGHLLLGEDSHSAVGLMKAQFNCLDLKPESAQMLFDPKQATRLRHLLASRKPNAACRGVSDSYRLRTSSDATADQALAERGDERRRAWRVSESLAYRYAATPVTRSPITSAWM